MSVRDPVLVYYGVGAVVTAVFLEFVAATSSGVDGHGLVTYARAIGGLGVVLIVVGLMRKPRKVCPYCAESIKAQAVVCRYCHSDLTTENPQSPSRH